MSVALGTASRARLDHEAAVVRDRLHAERRPGAAADAGAREAERRSWEQEREWLRRRAAYLTDLLDSARTVSDQRWSRVTPGSRIVIHDQHDDESYEVVLSVVDCHDGIETVSPYSPLGEQLELATMGALLEYETPGGIRRKVKVVSIRD